MPVPSRLRVTLARPSETITGVGLHSGRPTTVQILPASTGAGLIFVDSVSGQEIAASARNVVDTSRCTQLGFGGSVIQTVEHILSALAGCGVDDALIVSSGGEVPAVDGSALPFVTAIRIAGLMSQPDSVSVPLVVDMPKFFTAGDSVILVEPSDCFRATVVLDYPNHGYIGTQVFRYDSGKLAYDTEVAPSRTYGFLHEVEALRAHGLALGASEENALVLGADGYLGDRRFADELARHKMLDLIGDLALAGRPILANITAIKPGHAANTMLAQALLSSGHTHTGCSGE